MKKMMIYLLATGMGISACYIPFKANAGTFGKHHKMTKEERKEEREKRWEDHATMQYSNYNYAAPMAALPVDEDYVPNDVVNTMKNAYGPSLYDITTVKCSNGSDCYAVRVIGSNGFAETVIVDANNAPAMQ